VWIDGGSLLLGTRWADIRETRGFGSAMLSWRRDSYAEALRRTALLWARKCSSLYLRSRIGLSTVMDIASNAERVLRCQTCCRQEWKCIAAGRNGFLPALPCPQPTPGLAGGRRRRHGHCVEGCKYKDPLHYPVYRTPSTLTPLHLALNAGNTTPL